MTQFATDHQTRPSSLPASAHVGWALRFLGPLNALEIREPQAAPRSGDVVMVRVRALGRHSRLVNRIGERARFYAGDTIVGVIGQRYATDAYESTVDDWRDLSLVTNAGMISTVVSRNTAVTVPTEVELVGVVTRRGVPVNITDDARASRSGPPTSPLPSNVVLVVGAGMNSGKTTSTARLVRGLTQQGERVAAIKVTGSVSPGDRAEFRSAGAHHVADFSDFGVPSTWGFSRSEVTELYRAMVTEAAESDPDLIVVEIADGVLQRETQMLLSDPAIRGSVRGVLATAGCSPSSLHLVSEIERLGHRPLALTGIITNAPLFVSEFEARSDVPVIGNGDDGSALAGFLRRRLREVSAA